MKIAFIGSHGSGKSAAAHFMAAKLKKENPSKTIKVLEEAVRETAKIVGINNPNFQKLSILDSLYDQVYYGATYDIIICDRIAFDYTVYADFYGVHLDLDFYRISYNNAKEFDKIYFVRPDQTPIADDGFRFTDIEERNKIDKLFKKCLDDAFIEYEEISTEEVYKRG
jgi:nicotinamide riboside kinase